MRPLVLAAILVASGVVLVGMAAAQVHESGATWRIDARNISNTAEHNEWNPRFSPDGRFLSFERRDGSAQAIYVVDMQTPESAPQRVSSMRAEAASVESALLGLDPDDESFNTQLSFFPEGGGFVFTGNEGSGVYRLYRGSLGGETPQALTSESKEDGHPAVSPDGLWLVYVSARQGVGKLYLRDLTTGAERALTSGEHMELFPVWSPDGSALAYVSGDNDNHDIFVIHDVLGLEPRTIRLTSWSFDDLSPTFSSDGTLLAFYSSYNPSFEDKVWSIVTVPADGSGPEKGTALAERAVAVNVVKDPEVGPAWLPTDHTIIYALDRKKEFNPIHVVDTETRRERLVESGTRMNHDLTCSSQGVIAFRAQVASWDDIFVAPLATP
jgi:Tol biopolymer transport system component